MKTGLVLEGGAMRGMFTAGVLDVMMENDIWFPGAVGVSAGACLGINMKSKQIGRSVRYNKRFCNNKRYCSMESLVKTGDLFGAKFCYHLLPQYYDKFDFEAFTKSEMEFYVVATDLDTGKPMYHRLSDCGYEDMEWIRASASMPLVSGIVCVGGRKMLDGGTSDSIPLRFMEHRGYDKNVVILTKHREYRRKQDVTYPVSRVVYREYPEYLKSIKVRHKVYNRQMEYVFEQEKAGKALVICPPASLPIGRIEHDPEIIQQAYEIGRSEAVNMLDEIREFLA